MTVYLECSAVHCKARQRALTKVLPIIFQKCRPPEQNNNKVKCQLRTMDVLTGMVTEINS